MTKQIKDKYGSRRGAISAHVHILFFLLGKYNAYRKVDWGTIDRLVFVCKGNICRSAYSEAFAKSLGVEAISCGIDTVTGNPANNVTLDVAGTRGFDLSQHRTTPISNLQFKKSDLLLAMEPWHIDYLTNNFGDQSSSLLGLWGQPVMPYIHDPYGYSPAYFNNCFNYLENSIHEVVRKISKNKL